MKVTNASSPHRFELLRDFINDRGWRVGAELGLMRGQTFDFLLTHCPKLEVLYGVDVFQHMPDAPGEQPYRDVDHGANLEAVSKIVEKHGRRARLHVCTTEQAAKLVPDGSLDFVFIDADHSYEGVKQDIESWSPKVKKGGWITGHDYAPYWRGVVRAVDEAFGSRITLYECKIWAAEQL